MRRFVIAWSGWKAPVFVVAILCASLSAQTQYTQSVLYNFCTLNGCADGNGPTSTPLLDAHGNIYGVTGGGGSNDDGVVYELTSNGDGTWSESVLYSFCPQSGCLDGSEPRYSMVLDSHRNLYGYTISGGANDRGVIYQLSPPGGGSGPWTETVIYNVCSLPGCQDGSQPVGGLLLDSHGNLYGVASESGMGGGLVFELSPNGGGSWTYTVLYDFCSQTDCVDGSGPSGALIFDAHGNLYGTTAGGGANLAGAVFELSPGGGGSWTETVLYSFCPVSGCSDGNGPQNALVFDPQGNLYGTVVGGGPTAYGGVFQLSPAGGGSWTEQLLADFCPGPNCTNGYGPEGGMVIDAHGNLFGNTAFGGGSSNRGTVFELSPTGGGQFTYNVIYAYCPADNCDNGGGEPLAGVALDGQGNVYGAPGSGGLHSGGSVLELSPMQLIATTTALMSAPNPSTLGQSVTMTATVTAQSGPTPTGTVVFNSNGAQIGMATLNNSGVAVLNYSGLPVGTDSLTAMYQGSSTLAPSTSNTVPQVVNPAVSMTGVVSAPNPSTAGDTVTITATVSPSGPPAPTGTVGFTSNGAGISGCSAVTLSSQVAVCMTSSLAVGTDTLAATYSGDSNYTSSMGSTQQVVNPAPIILQFVSATPCRLVDTRTSGGPITGGTSRSFTIPQLGGCNIPTSAQAYSLNVTVVPHGSLGYLTIWPTGESQPTVSTMNSPDGRVKANAAIVPAGMSGAVSVFVSNTADVVLDINGYFNPVGDSTLAFYPLTPCRVLDTRNPDGPLGGPVLAGGMERDFPVLSSTCNIPSTALAYSLNFTVVPNPAGSQLGYLTVWPTGQSQPTVSTLNNLTATVVANAAIVPAGTTGQISVFPSNQTDLVVDVNGYFAPAGTGGLSLYPVTPCRVLDTRQVGSGNPFENELTVNVSGTCAPPATAQAYVFNATVVPTGALGYLTLWPDGEDQPTVSTLNAVDGFITSNMAIVPTQNESIDAFASNLTQLVLDISSYFAP